MDPSTKEKVIDRAFFKRHEAAAEIRQASIDFMRAWRELSEQTDLDRAVPESHLESARSRLVELGVTPGMHEGRDFRYFTSRPLEAAQYCAGQLLRQRGEDADSSKLNDAYFEIDDAGACSLSETLETSVLTGSNPGHENVLKLAKLRDAVTVVTNLLDAHEEVWADNK
jgi:hypothetical protein